MTETKDELFERFYAKFVPEPNSGCWLWIGTGTRNGYGQFWFDGQFQLAHRAARQIFVGPIPADLCVLHRCDVKGCVNPDHLFLGTQRDNMLDSSRKGRLNNANLKKTHCPLGHPYRKSNLYLLPRGGRGCRKCRKRSNRDFRRRSKRPKQQELSF